MLITWNTEVNAPGCPGKIVAEDGIQPKPDYPGAENDPRTILIQTILIQTDWDYCGVASTFGWSPSMVQMEDCDHDGTDGTVDCPCGLSALDFITAAGKYLADNDGATVEDPGYFE